SLPSIYTANIKSLPDTTPVDFRTKPFDDTARLIQDLYNVPSVCIHYGNVSNICRLFSVPGIPRFDIPDIGGIKQAFETFQDVSVSAKMEDCSNRSRLNFSTAMIWTY